MFFLSLMAPIFCAITAVNSPTVESLTAASDSAYALLHSFDVTIEQKIDGRPMTKLRWSKDASRERSSIEMTLRDVNDASQISFSDNYSDGTYLRMLRNADPKKAYRLTPDNQQHLAGGISAAPIKQSGYHTGAFHLLLSPNISVTEPSPQLFRELMATAISKKGADAVRLLGETEIAGENCWHIHVAHPGVVNEETNTVGTWANVDYYLSPRMNFMIRRIDVHLLDAKGRSLGTIRREVEKVRDCGNGVFFPEKVILCGIDENGAVRDRGKIESVTTIHAINEPLPESTFNFRFPEGLIVTEYPAKGNRHDTHLVGKDGNFTRSFSGAKNELHDFVESSHIDSRTKPPYRSWLWPALVFLSAIAITSAIAFYRRRNTYNAS